MVRLLALLNVVQRHHAHVFVVQDVAVHNAHASVRHRLGAQHEVRVGSVQLHDRVAPLANSYEVGGNVWVRRRRATLDANDLEVVDVLVIQVDACTVNANTGKRDTDVGVSKPRLTLIASLLLCRSANGEVTVSYQRQLPSTCPSPAGCRTGFEGRGFE